MIIDRTSPETNAHPTTTTAQVPSQSPGPSDATAYSVA